MMKNLFRRPFVLTLRLWMRDGDRIWKRLWSRCPGGGPPHWVNDLLHAFSRVNLLPTFCLMALAPRHFFRRTPLFRKNRSHLYKTPLGFVISAIPYVVGLHWLPIGELYRSGLRLVLIETEYLFTLALVHANCCLVTMSHVLHSIDLLIGWLNRESATGIRVISAVLFAIPVWMPIVSCFVAVMLLLPRMFNVIGTKIILPFLVAVDPRTYLRIRGQDYWWSLMYFAVYFVLAFPVCLLALYTIYHEFYFPSNTLMLFGPVRLWWMATQSALAATIVTAPYNELLRAAVVIPTPLMQTVRFSKLSQLLDEMKICVQLAKSGKCAPVERNALLCEAEFKQLVRQNKNDIRKAAKRSTRWVARLNKETTGCFGRLNVHHLLDAQRLPLSPEVLRRIVALSDGLLEHGATNLEPVFPVKVPIGRRIARDVLLVAVGVCVLLVAIWLTIFFVK